MTTKVFRNLLGSLKQMMATGVWSFSPKQLSPVKILSPNATLPFEQKHRN